MQLLSSKYSEMHHCCYITSRLQKKTDLIETCSIGFPIAFISKLLSNHLRHNIQKHQLQATQPPTSSLPPMKLTNIFFAVFVASTTVSAIPIPEASPEASPGYCRGFGQPCMRLKRSIEMISESLVQTWDSLSAESRPFTVSPNKATITTNSIESAIAQGLAELDSNPAKRSPDPRYCWGFGQPCLKRSEGTETLTPGSSEGTRFQPI